VVVPDVVEVFEAPDRGNPNGFEGGAMINDGAVDPKVGLKVMDNQRQALHCLALTQTQLNWSLEHKWDSKLGLKFENCGHSKRHSIPKWRGCRIVWSTAGEKG